jgi:hypothetical protein
MDTKTIIIIVIVISVVAVFFCTKEKNISHYKSTSGTSGSCRDLYEAPLFKYCRNIYKTGHDINDCVFGLENLRIKGYSKMVYQYFWMKKCGMRIPPGYDT